MQRVVSGVVLGAGAVAVLWFSTAAWLVAGLAVGVVLLGLREAIGLARGLGAAIMPVPTVVTAVAVCLATALPAAPLPAALLATFVVLAAASTLSGRAGAAVVRDTLASLGVVAYLAVPLGALVMVHLRDGREASLLLLATIVVSDTAQYYVGRWRGRRPLAPEISPHKTIEGAVGGIVLGTVTMVVAGAWGLPTLGPAARALVGAAVVGAGIAGDLFESSVKRGAGVKDASSIIPGHGGVLDRLDALLFAAPVYSLMLQYLR